MLMIERMKAIDTLCFKIYRGFNRDGQFPQLQRSLNNYITAAPELKMAQIPRSMRQDFITLDQTALSKDEVHKGQIMQMLVRTALAIDTMCKKNKDFETELEPIEKYVIKQIVYLYSNKQLDQLFVGLVSGAITLVDKESQHSIFEEVTKGLNQTRLAKLKEAIEEQSALEVIIEVDVHFRYTKGISDKINDIIAEQEEVLVPSKITADKIKARLRELIAKNSHTEAVKERLNDYIADVDSETMETTEVVKTLNDDADLSDEVVSQIIAEVMGKTTDVNNTTINILFPLANKNNDLTTGSPSK